MLDFPEKVGIDTDMSHDIEKEKFNQGLRVGTLNDLPIEIYK